MADRPEWEQTAAQSRHLAIAADAELRRRHPERKIEPICSAEPAPVSDTERGQLQPVLDGVLAEPADRIRDLAAERQAFRAKLDERQRLVVPSEDLDWAGLGEALPSWRASRRDPILQPPKPQITPSARILQLTAERDAEPEAANLRPYGMSSTTGVFLVSDVPAASTGCTKNRFPSECRSACSGRILAAVTWVYPRCASLRSLPVPCL